MMTFAENLLSHVSKNVLSNAFFMDEFERQTEHRDIAKKVRGENERKTKPLFSDRAEAYAWLQTNNRTNTNRHRNAAGGGRFQPCRSHIATVVTNEGEEKSEVFVLHATKGWRKGIH